MAALGGAAGIAVDAEGAYPEAHPRPQLEERLAGSTDQLIDLVPTPAGLLTAGVALAEAIGAEGLFVLQLLARLRVGVEVVVEVQAVEVVARH